jgi:hypothetical protein
MRPHERRLIGRLMMIATVLVALMVAVLIYAGAQNSRRGASPASTDNSASPAASTSGAAGQ